MQSNAYRRIHTALLNQTHEGSAAWAVPDKDHLSCIRESEQTVMRIRRAPWWDLKGPTGCSCPKDKPAPLQHGHPYTAAEGVRVRQRMTQLVETSYPLLGVWPLEDIYIEHSVPAVLGPSHEFLRAVHLAPNLVST